MTPQSYRANLTAADFPLLAELQGRTVVIGGIDQNFSRQANSVKNKDRDIGIPQVYYMHNVLPTDAGLSTVSFQQIAAPPLDSDTTFQEQFILRDGNGNVAYLVNTSSGRNYVLPSLGTGWIRTTDKAPLTSAEVVTTAYVNGETYIYFGKLGCFKYDFATNTLVAVVLTGIDITKVLGICASNGYMIAWTVNTVLRSSTISPVDFTPSLATGAGGGGVQEAKGDIVCCLRQNSGFILYTKANAVSAVYTGNTQYPFSYKELLGAGGLSRAGLVANNGNSTAHVAYTTGGLQELGMNNATIIHPQITDFIAGSQFEDFDEDTYVFTSTSLSTPMKKKVSIVANRYLVISYGKITLTHALVYDLALGRWGKLKVNHVDCFEYIYPSGDVVEAPKRNIGFIQADGTVLVAVSSYSTTGSGGVIIAGKYQLDRNRMVELQEVHVDTVRTDSTLSVKVLSSLDGTNNLVKDVVSGAATGTYRRFNARIIALNFSIVFKGAFHLNSLVLKFNDGGETR